MPSTEQVFAALKNVPVESLGKDVVAAGAVRNLVISGGAVSFDLELVLPVAPAGNYADTMRDLCSDAVRTLDGVTSVHVKSGIRVRAPEQKRAVMPGVKYVVAVASGKGGVGKSTTAANLALALHREGASVGLLDADIYGPSMPTMLGASGRPETVGDKMIRPITAHGIKLMSIGFLVDPDQPMVWRGPMVHGALSQFL